MAMAGLIKVVQRSYSRT